MAVVTVSAMTQLQLSLAGIGVAEATEVPLRCPMMARRWVPAAAGRTAAVAATQLARGREAPSKLLFAGDIGNLAIRSGTAPILQRASSLFWETERPGSGRGCRHTISGAAYLVDSGAVYTGSVLPHSSEDPPSSPHIAAADRSPIPCWGWADMQIS